MNIGTVIQSEKSTFFGGPNVPPDFNTKDKYSSMSNKVLNVKDIMAKVYNIEEGSYDDDLDQPVSIMDLKALLSGSIAGHAGGNNAGNGHNSGDFMGKEMPTKITSTTNGHHGKDNHSHHGKDQNSKEIKSHDGHVALPFKQQLKPLARPSPS
jgi:hypothetical protein